MSLFKDIDGKLEFFAKKLKAKLTIDRPWAPKSLHPFEERRIDWEEDGLNKAIIIQPYFGLSGVDTTKWSLINVAWIKRKGIAQKSGWKVKLIENEDFSQIEKSIDELLKKSFHNLKVVQCDEVEKLIRKVE